MHVIQIQIQILLEKVLLKQPPKYFVGKTCVKDIILFLVSYKSPSRESRQNITFYCIYVNIDPMKVFLLIYLLCNAPSQPVKLLKNMFKGYQMARSQNHVTRVAHIPRSDRHNHVPLCRERISYYTNKMVTLLKAENFENKIEKKN